MFSNYKLKPKKYISFTINLYIYKNLLYINVENFLYFGPSLNIMNDDK
jgi:hypothetical protein